MASPLHLRLGDDFFGRVPAGPGVYLMLGQSDDLLYVGKAKSLRTRLRSYTRIEAGRDDERLVQLVAHVHAIRWEECRSEAEALARETELLRALRPPYNFAQADATTYLAIVVADKRGWIHLHLGEDPLETAGTVYCFPFAARTPDAYKALMRVLFLAQPNRSSVQVPSRLNRAPGAELRVHDDIRRALHSFLAGRSVRLLSSLEDRLGRDDQIDGPLRRSVTRDLDTLGDFYTLGPRAVRRLQLKHGADGAGASSEELGQLLAAEMGAQVRAEPSVDRRAVERQVLELHDAGLRFRAIAARLNRDNVPRLRGGGKWHAVDVAELVGDHVAKSTRTPPAPAQRAGR